MIDSIVFKIENNSGRLSNYYIFAESPLKSRLRNLPWINVLAQASKVSNGETVYFQILYQTYVAASSGVLDNNGQVAVLLGDDQIVDPYGSDTGRLRHIDDIPPQQSYWVTSLCFEADRERAKDVGIGWLEFDTDEEEGFILLAHYSDGKLYYHPDY